MLRGSRVIRRVATRGRRGLRRKPQHPPVGNIFRPRRRIETGHHPRAAKRTGALAHKPRHTVRTKRGEHPPKRLRIGQPTTAIPTRGAKKALSAHPRQIDSCFDLDTEMIIGGPLDGVQPHPGNIQLYEDNEGYPRVVIDVAGDAQADLPVCSTKGTFDIDPRPPGREPDCDPQDTECETYDGPAIIIGPDGCDIGFNGCGDTIGVDVVIPGNSTVDVNIPAAIEFTPRYFVYTGGLSTFTVSRIFVANGPNSNFGAGYSIDYYALSSFTSKRVSWPTFYNSPPLTLTLTNITAADAAFQGLLIGIAAHQ